MIKLINNLYGRIALIFLLLLLILAIIQVLVFIHYSSQFVTETDQKLNLDLAENLAKKFKPYLSDSIDYHSIEHSFHEMMVMNPRVEFYLIDSTGNILAYFADPEKIKRMQVNINPINQMLAAGADINLPLYGDDPRHPNRQKPFSVSPVKMANNQIGYLYVILGGELFDSALDMVADSYIFRTSTIALTINFILTAFIGLLLFFLLTKRLRTVTNAVKKFEQGDYQSRIESISRDEIGQLSDAFNKMADTINSNIDQIKNSDRMRRDLIANISHDLRSPLASVQGYLETIFIKEKSLNPGELKHYLNIVYKNIQQLNKLVYDLLELSKLDAKQIKPKPEPFSLAELTQDVVLKFKPQAEKHKIEINSFLPSELPMVNADIAMIENALSNLLENALNYTPEQGNVTVGLEVKDKIVKVQVSDSGSGIPNEDLPHIFERFYRADKSRSTQGTGLGLAITKKIIEAHQSQITVDSRLNSGTTFTFSLSKWDQQGSVSN